MLLANLWTPAGLNNGARGIVVDILYEDGSSPPSLPLTVLVHFPDYCGPTFTSERSELPVVAIVPLLVEWTWKGKGNRSCLRLQVPLRLSSASTIHKNQGLTLDYVIFNIGLREFNSGSTYTGVTRVRSSDTILIVPVTDDRLKNIGKGAGLKDRMCAEARIEALSKITQRRVVAFISESGARSEMWFALSPEEIKVLNRQCALSTVTITAMLGKSAKRSVKSNRKRVANNRSISKAKTKANVVSTVNSKSKVWPVYSKSKSKVKLVMSRPR